MSEETINFLNNIDFENNDVVYEKIVSLFEENQELKKQLEEWKKQNQQLKERLVRIDNYLNKHYTVENQYWFDDIQDIIKDR